MVCNKKHAVNEEQHRSDQSAIKITKNTFTKNFTTNITTVTYTKPFRIKSENLSANANEPQLCDNSDSVAKNSLLNASEETRSENNNNLLSEPIEAANNDECELFEHKPIPGHVEPVDNKTFIEIQPAQCITRRRASLELGERHLENFWYRRRTHSTGNDTDCDHVPDQLRFVQNTDHRYAFSLKSNHVSFMR